MYTGPAPEGDGPRSLAEMQIEEVDTNICEDNVANRTILRKNRQRYQALYDTNGTPLNLIEWFPPEVVARRATRGYENVRPILTDPKNLWSDYISPLDFDIDFTEAPYYVFKAADNYRRSVDLGLSVDPDELPARCKFLRRDGTRCFGWTWYTGTDMCRFHLNGHNSVAKAHAAIARTRLADASAAASEVLEELMLDARAEQVRLKAATEILDRAGVRGGSEVTFNGEITTSTDMTAAQIINERLSNLAKKVELALPGPASSASSDENSPDEILDAEVIELPDPEPEKAHEEEPTDG